MTTLALSQPAVLQWNWPRVGALSGALSLHFIMFVLLLVPPAAMTLLRPVLPVVTDVRILEPPPKQFEEPAPPTPKKIVHEVRQLRTPPKPIQAPVAPPVESQMPAQVADPGPPGPTTTTTAPADVAPVALAYNTRTRIPYPLDAAKLRQQGTVILNVLVGSDGLPQTVEIEKSSGFRALDIAARDAVRHWTFQAGTRNGITAALWARVPITFTLNVL